MVSSDNTVVFTGLTEGEKKYLSKIHKEQEERLRYMASNQDVIVVSDKVYSIFEEVRRENEMIDRSLEKEIDLASFDEEEDYMNLKFNKVIVQLKTRLKGRISLHMLNTLYADHDRLCTEFARREYQIHKLNELVGQLRMELGIAEADCHKLYEEKEIDMREHQKQYAELRMESNTLYRIIDIILEKVFGQEPAKHAETTTGRHRM